eukprot:243910_1
MALVHNAEPFDNGRERPMEKESRELVTTLTLMGYEKDYVLRAIQVHRKSKFGSNWDLSLLVDIILRLKAKDKDTVFIPHFASKKHALQLNVGDGVDYRYNNGRFILCRILQKRNGNNSCILKLHPMGRVISDTKYDKTCDIYEDYIKLATAKSISLRRIKSPKHIFYNIQIDNYIDINPLYKPGHEGWKSGRVIKQDPNSSQIKVLYHNESDNRNYTYWVHLQNCDEVAEFRSKCTKVDANQLTSFHNDFVRSRVQSESVIDPNYAFVSMNAYQPPNALPLMNIKNGMEPKPVPRIKDDFNNNKSQDIAAANGHIHKQPRRIPKIKDDFQSKASAFDHEMRSVALGNDLMMDDIIEDMSNKVTPLGSPREEESKAVINNQRRKPSLVLERSHSNAIKPMDVMASSKTCNTQQQMIQNLCNIGYTKEDIAEAMDHVSDVENVNLIIDYIDSHRITTEIHFKVRQKTYDPNANKSSKDEHIDVDAIAFDDDDDGKEDIWEKLTKTAGNDDAERVSDYVQNDILFYVDCKRYKEKKHVQEEKMRCTEEPFVPCMTMEEIHNLKEMDCIDYKNIFGQFMRATVIARDEIHNTLKILFQGWTHQYQVKDVWDGWAIMHPSEEHKFARYASISCRPSQQWPFKFLRAGSLVELRPTASPYHALDKTNGYLGWQCAEVFGRDYKSGQIQCKYEYKNDYYLYWTHIDNELEITYIDNCYDIGDHVCVYNQAEHEWLMANVTDIEMNVITVCYDDNDQSTEQIHLRFDEDKLMFPRLRLDIKCIKHAIRKEKLQWELVVVTPTNNTLYQCFAYMMYGDLNLAIHIKKECMAYMEEHREKQDIIMALCTIYKVRIRIVEYKVSTKRLNMVMNHGDDNLDVPMILLSKHLNKYYNIIIDTDSIHRIPFHSQ